MATTKLIVSSLIGIAVPFVHPAAASAAPETPPELDDWMVHASQELGATLDRDGILRDADGFEIVDIEPPTDGFEDEWSDAGQLAPYANKMAFIAGTSSFPAACGIGGLSGATALVDDISAIMVGWGGWSTTKLKNTSVKWKHWADKDRSYSKIGGVSKGEDHLNVDAVDFGYISTHMYRWDTNGDSVYDAQFLAMGEASPINKRPDGSSIPSADKAQLCGMFFGAASSSVDAWNQTLWGDDSGKQKLMILDGCRTLEFSHWTAGWYNKMTSGSLGVVLGFHGQSYFGTDPRTKLKQYINDAKNSMVGKKWVDLMSQAFSDSNDGNSLKQQCAVAMIFASTLAEAENIYNNAGINAPINRNNPTKVYYFFKDGCDPFDGPALPATSPWSKGINAVG